MRDSIDPYSKVPLYHQLYELLRERLTNGQYRPGDLIAPESELIEKYQVSRTTVRQVLEILVKEGLVYRQRGRGTFVAHRGLEEALTRIVNFTEDMRRRGFEPGTRVLSAGLTPAPPDIAERLEIKPGEELARIDRLRLADGEPLSVEQSHLLHRYCPGILEHDHAAGSLRDRLRENYGVRWSLAKQSIRAVQANRELARALLVPAKSALLFIERVSFDQQHIPVEFLRIYYRGDRYTLFTELAG
ncbi:MAG: GntR family transcriptional regulator [Acidobacteriota bacterium]